MAEVPESEESSMLEAPVFLMLKPMFTISPRW
jgi:hypothetical protein